MIGSLIKGLDLVGHGFLQDTTANSGNKKMLNKAAVEFEGVLLTSLFQKMLEDSSCTENATCGGNTLRDLSVQELASSISVAGGIGISKIISSYLEHKAGSDEAA